MSDLIDKIKARCATGDVEFCKLYEKFEAAQELAERRDAEIADHERAIRRIEPKRRAARALESRLWNRIKQAIEAESCEFCAKHEPDSICDLCSTILCTNCTTTTTKGVACPNCRNA